MLPREFADQTYNPLAGRIDAVHIAAAALHGGAFTPSRRLSAGASTRALWQLDEVAGTTAADASGNGNTLTWLASKWQGDTCYGVSADSALCGDGVLAAGIEQCDDGNTDSCDGCENCQNRNAMLPTAGNLQTATLSAWGADTFCPVQNSGMYRPGNPTIPEPPRCCAISSTPLELVWIMR